jgi:hypothetical protein
MDGPTGFLFRPAASPHSTPLASWRPGIDPAEKTRIWCAAMKKTPTAAEEARQWAMTIRLLYAIGVLTGLLACLLIARML